LGFTAFFFVPIIGCCSDDEVRRPAHVIECLFRRNSRSLRPCWKALFGFQSDAMIGWLENSAIYRLARRDSDHCGDSRRLRTGAHSVHRTSNATAITLITMIMPRPRRTAALSRDEHGKPYRHTVGRDSAVLVFPFWRLPLLHLLFLDDSQGSPVSGQSRWLQ